jgi:hypothetical protein
MERFEKNGADERAFEFAALVYYAVMLVAFVVGLYGFFSLLWLASSEVERSSHLIGLIL